MSETAEEFASRFIGDSSEIDDAETELIERIEQRDAAVRAEALREAAGAIDALHDSEALLSRGANRRAAERIRQLPGFPTDEADR